VCHLESQTPRMPDARHIVPPARQNERDGERLALGDDSSSERNRKEYCAADSEKTHQRKKEQESPQLRAPGMIACFAPELEQSHEVVCRFTRERAQGLRIENPSGVGDGEIEKVLSRRRRKGVMAPYRRATTPSNTSDAKPMTSISERIHPRVPSLAQRMNAGARARRNSVSDREARQPRR
jgi:hypothetical protein